MSVLRHYLRRIDSAHAVAGKLVVSTVVSLGRNIFDRREPIPLASHVEQMASIHLIGFNHGGLAAHPGLLPAVFGVHTQASSIAACSFVFCFGALQLPPFQLFEDQQTVFRRERWGSNQLCRELIGTPHSQRRCPSGASASEQGLTMGHYRLFAGKLQVGSFTGIRV